LILFSSLPRISNKQKLYIIQNKVLPVLREELAKRKLDAPIEYTQRAGDIALVPAGWWHAVVNLNHTVAMTENFASCFHFADVRNVLKAEAPHFFTQKWRHVVWEQHLDSGFDGTLANVSIPAGIQNIQNSSNESKAATSCWMLPPFTECMGSVPSRMKRLRGVTASVTAGVTASLTASVGEALESNEAASSTSDESVQSMFKYLLPTTASPSGLWGESDMQWVLAARESYDSFRSAELANCLNLSPTFSPTSVRDPQNVVQPAGTSSDLANSLNLSPTSVRDPQNVVQPAGTSSDLANSLNLSPTSVRDPQNVVQPSRTCADLANSRNLSPTFTSAVQNVVQPSETSSDMSQASHDAKATPTATTAAASTTIPKILHQIWLGSELPIEMRQRRDRWIAKHPEWQHVLWTDESTAEAIAKGELSMRASSLFEQASNMGAKADILRYNILATFGGVYLDTDYECVRTLDALVDGVLMHKMDLLPRPVQWFAGLSNVAGVEVNNGLMGSIPNHPLTESLLVKLEASEKPKQAVPSRLSQLLSFGSGGNDTLASFLDESDRAAIDKHNEAAVPKNDKHAEAMATIARTGPGFLTRAIFEGVNQRSLIEQGIVVFPPTVFHAMPNNARQSTDASSTTGNGDADDSWSSYVRPETVAVHLWAASWMP
jgi:hypothetical protein